MGFCRTSDGQKGTWKTSGGEGVPQDAGVGPIDGLLPMRLNVTHQHLTTQHVLETRTNTRKYTSTAESRQSRHIGQSWAIRRRRQRSQLRKRVRWS
jgi:hypothetical protein